MKKMNLDLVQVAGLAGSVLTIAATLLTNYAGEKKLDKTIEEKVERKVENKEEVKSSRSSS